MNTFLRNFSIWFEKKKRLYQILGGIVFFLGVAGLEWFLLSRVGNSATAIITIPAILVAWGFGRSLGLLAGLFLSLTSLGLIHRLNPAPALLPNQIIATLSGLVVISLLVFLADWARQVYLRIQHELAEKNRIEASLRASEERYRTMFQMTSEAIIIFDLEGNLLEVNQIAENWLGYSHAELMNMSMVDIETVENANRLTRRIAELLESEQAMYESALSRQDGSILPVEINARLIPYQNQKVAFATARDISQRKAIETAEHENFILTSALREISADLSSTLQLEEVLDRILKNLQRILQHDAACIMLLENNEVYIGKHRGYTERGQGLSLDDKSVPLETQLLLKYMNDTRIPLIIPDTRSSPQWHSFHTTNWARSYAGAPLIYKGETIGFLNLDSATSGSFREEHSGRLQAFAHHAAVAILNARRYASVQKQAQVDELTGLLNRRGLASMAQREVIRAARFNRPLAALLIDIDNFKKFNDRYSYAVGDEILSNIAQRMQNNLRKVDLVSRWGGDEFLIVLVETDLSGAITAAEHLHRVITERAFETSQGSMPVTVSIGAASLDNARPDLNMMIEAAGESVHQAKFGGRNQVAGNSN